MRVSLPPVAAPLSVALVAVALLFAGCEGPGAAAYPPREPTKGKAALPDKPDLNPKLAPAQYDDGAWSVRGVRESGTAGRKGAPVQVRGYVAKVHTCPAEQKVCKPAPHLLLSDLKSLQGQRLLVGGHLPEGAAEGQRITVEGRMVTSSGDGLYFAPSGLLLVAPPPEPAEGADAK